MAAKNCLHKCDVLPDASGVPKAEAQTFSVSRLKNRADFLNCKKGARSHERAFVLQAIKRAVDDGTYDSNLRIGFTVTKKIGNAVVRNRIKRRLREAVRRAEIPSGLACHDAVLIAREEALHQPFAELVMSITKALDKVSKPHKKSHKNRLSEKADTAAGPSKQ